MFIMNIYPITGNPIFSAMKNIFINSFFKNSTKLKSSFSKYKGKTFIESTIPSYTTKWPFSEINTKNASKNINWPIIGVSSIVGSIAVASPKPDSIPNNSPAIENAPKIK